MQFFSARQEAVLMAALEGFNAQGVEACSIATICANSGASVGSVYHHFGSKEGLAAALFSEGVARFQNGYLAALDGTPDAQTGIRALVCFHMQWVVSNPQWARYLLRTRADTLQPAAQEAVAQRNAAFYQSVGEWFAPHVRAGVIRRLPRSLYVALLVGPCQEWARHYVRMGEDEIAECVEALADAIWFSLRSPPSEQGSASPRSFSMQSDRS